MESFISVLIGLMVIWLIIKVTGKILKFALTIALLGLVIYFFRNMGL